VRHTRLAQLERQAQGWTCPKCALPPALPGGLGQECELEGLSKAKREELLRLFELTATPPCVRCGRAGREMSRLTDDQLDRAIAPLRVVVGPEHALSGLCAFDADLDPA
jgi:hypothetical protein